MKSFLFFFAMLIMCSSALAQTKIQLADAAKHVGDSVMVEGKIYSARVFTNDDNEPTLCLLNLGAEYPNQLLTVAVFPSYTPLPDKTANGKTANVIGKIILYKGKPEIEVRNSGQLKLE